MSKNGTAAIAAPISYPILDPSSDLAEALRENQGGIGISITSLPKVKMPSGGGKAFSWTDSGNNERTEKEITGLFVYYGKYGTLWPTAQPSSDGLPLLVTWDLQTAFRVGSDFGDLDSEAIERARTGDRTYNWQALPYSSFKSAANGRGKRCNEYRILGLLQPGEAWPVMVYASAASIRACDDFFQLLSIPFYRVSMKLTLDAEKNPDGQTFSKLVPSYLGSISREEGEIIKSTYTDALKRAVEQEVIKLSNQE